MPMSLAGCCPLISLVVLLAATRASGFCMGLGPALQPLPIVRESTYRCRSTLGQPRSSAFAHVRMQDGTLDPTASERLESRMAQFEHKVSELQAAVTSAAESIDHLEQVNSELQHQNLGLQEAVRVAESSWKRDLANVARFASLS
eukprot:1301596-Rhodomonas_salina.1